MDAPGQINACIQRFVLICINAGIRKSDIPQFRIWHFTVNFNGSVRTAAGFLWLAILETQIVNPVLRGLHLIVEFLSHTHVGFIRSRVNQLYIGTCRRNGSVGNIGPANGTIAFRAIVLPLDREIRPGIDIGSFKSGEIVRIRKIILGCYCVNTVQEQSLVLRPKGNFHISCRQMEGQWNTGKRLVFIQKRGRIGKLVLFREYFISVPVRFDLTDIIRPQE